MVTRRNAGSVVLMSEEDYEGLMETVHLLESGERHATAALNQDSDRGKFKKRESDKPAKAR